MTEKQKKANREYYERNKDKINKHRRDYSKRTREARNKAKALWKSKNKDKVKSSWLRYQYGIDLESWETLFKQQNSCCAICTSDVSVGHGWCVDHCHVSGKVRGILCNTCNSGIGLLRENISTLESAIEYLRKHA